MGASITLTGVELASRDPFAAVDRALRAAESRVAERLDAIDVQWRWEPRGDLSFSGKAASISARAAPAGRSVQFLSPRTQVRAGDLALGPFWVNLERDPEAARARVALDPDVPDGPSIILVDHAGILHFAAQAPRAHLMRYGVPQRFVGLPDGDDVEVEVSVDAKMSEKGEVSGTGAVALYGIHAGPSVPIDATVEFKVDGSPKSVRLNGDGKVGPFPALMRGDWAKEAPQHFTLAFDGAPFSCAELARARAHREVGVSGALAAELARFGGTLQPKGTTSESGVLAWDLEIPPRVQVRWSQVSTCGVDVFPP
jgi:hypothetical protein